MAPPSVNSFNSSNTNNIRTNNHNNTPATVPINEDQSSLGFSQAYALGVSIPTSKFNTEAFGSLSVRPVSGTTSGVGTTSTGPGTGVVTDIENQFDPDSLDDDFDIPLDIDDDFGMMEMHVDKDGHDLETTAETGRNGIGFVESHSSMTQNGDDRVEDSQAVMEAAALKQKVAELEAELAKKQEQLLVESGRASVLKDKLEDVNKTHVALSQRFKEAQVQYETEKQSMEEKHEKALANANMNHQFEVQRYILDGPTAPKGVKSSQQVRATSTQPTTALFPKEFSGFASTQSSIRVVQTRNDDGFSHRNLGVAPISPRKPVMHGTNTSLEKPRPFQIPSEFSKTARPVFGFNSDIPTQSEEEIIRDKLLAGHEHSYGLRQLLTIEADEEKISPLPGSQDYERNIRLEQITENCVTALSNLILDVNPHSKSEALKATTTLLRASLVMRKPLHTVNSLQVMTTLCYSFEDIANEVCRGAVPFLESEREDPLAVIPSDMSLTSALACIHFLFLNRMALPIPTTALPPFPSMRREYSLTKDAEELLEANIFLLLNLVVRQHLETKSTSRIFVPLIRLRIYNKVLRLRLEQNRYSSLNRTLELLDLIVRDPECSRLVVGWSISKMSWTEAFSHIETFVDLIDIKTENSLDMAVG
ncbi:hypothetical protein BGZ49_004642 [Haplosporangium sp. Z 27]|nr:hypothetical protein BGZ49_004642 [Haplosporangium sp. Z 27]